MNAILTGKRPVRPSRVTDAVWKLMNLCWNDDPYKRPEMAFIALEMGKFADQAELERTKQQKASKASQPLREYS